MIYHMRKLVISSVQRAQTKYGENHYKLAARLGLATPNKPLSTTDLGIAYYLTEDSDKRKEMLKRLPSKVIVCAREVME